MKIVIDIDDNIYTRLFDNGDVKDIATVIHDKIAVETAIRNGTPLPEGHRRLMILSEDTVKERQVKLDFSCQKWISEVDLSYATVAIIEPAKEVNADEV